MKENALASLCVNWEACSIMGGTLRLGPIKATVVEMAWVVASMSVCTSAEFQVLGDNPTVAVDLV